ncbi:CheB methylesterase domain-containing protein [Candidatus Entotheonella palauensis]|nr:CheB methylesterase domain-containing protein [Candidatus Entotheonella palauensis]
MVGRVIAIGCSTGGPRALKTIIPYLPADFPAAILIVQHMKKSHTQELAMQLDRLSQLEVKEAEAGDRILAGRVLLAPGGMHMVAGMGKRVTLLDTEPVNFVKPSVDVLFESVAAIYREHSIGVILTGIGHDGTEGARLIRTAGGRIIAEDQSTSVIFGMPKAVIDDKLAHEIQPLQHIAPRLKSLTKPQQ